MYSICSIFTTLKVLESTVKIKIISQECKTKRKASFSLKCLRFCRFAETYQATCLVYTKYVILEGQLSSAEMQVAAGKSNNGKLQPTFKSFQFILKGSCKKQKNLIDRSDNLIH